MKCWNTKEHSKWIISVSASRGFATQKIFVRPPKNHKKITKNLKKSQKNQKITKISKNRFKFNMGEIVKIKKSSKKSESSKFQGKNQKIFVHPRIELRTPRPQEPCLLYILLINGKNKLIIRSLHTSIGAGFGFYFWQFLKCLYTQGNWMLLPFIYSNS